MEGQFQSNSQATNGQSTNDEQQNQSKQIHQEEKGLIHPDPILHPDPMSFDQEGVLMDPKTDYGFKFLFGTPENKDILMDFLNVLLKGERHITDLQFMNSELLDEDPEYRRCIYDIHCQEADGMGTEPCSICVRSSRSRAIKKCGYKTKANRWDHTGITN